MREMKFRAWDGDTKTLTPEATLQELCERSAGRGNPIIDWEALELMQYTYIKDRHGNDIFEGDVLRSDWATYEVVFHLPDGKNNIYGFVKRAIDRDEWLGFNKCEDDSEIIGNVYENPELLT